MPGSDLRRSRRSRIRPPTPRWTGRFNIWQTSACPSRPGRSVVPYSVLNLGYYTQDLSGDDQGRVYGGGGLRASIPFSRLYPDVESDLFNLCGLYHKILLSGNYFIADSNTRLTALPQLDRLNDDTTDQALRDIRPRRPHVNPANATFRRRRLCSIRSSTRCGGWWTTAWRRSTASTSCNSTCGSGWQTKRDMPGNQHVVDWMTLGIGMSVFRGSNRDNFGESLGIIEYDWVWNIGDRTALVSDGWFETIDGGPHVFNAGGHLQPAGPHQQYLGYRQIDPLESKAVIAAVTCAFSAEVRGRRARPGTSARTMRTTR